MKDETLLPEVNPYSIMDFSVDTILKVLDPAIIEKEDYFFMKELCRERGWSCKVDQVKQKITGNTNTGQQFTVDKYFDKYSYIATESVKLKHHHIKNDKDYPFWIHKGQVFMIEVYKKYPNGDISGPDPEDDYIIEFREDGTPFCSSKGLYIGFYVDTNKGRLYWPYTSLTRNGLLVEMVKYQLNMED